MAKSREYWTKRFTELEDSLLNVGESQVKDLDRQYQLAMSSIEKEILKWYTRLADNNDISLAEAKKILNAKELKEFKWDVLEYIKNGEENALDQRWMKQLENASSRFHITKLETMKLYLQQYAEELYGKQTEGFNTMAQEIYTTGYYRTAYEIQKGFNVGWDLFALDTKRINKVIFKPWAADGQNFSSRIWNNKTQLVNSLHTQLTQSIIRGDSPRGVINAIAKEFDISKHRAGRLVMTEAAFFASAAQKDCFDDLDVERYEIVSTLDSRTSPICQGLDGKVFDMKDYEVGVSAPPFHPYCRTTTVPYFEDNYGERAARDEDGETYYVPSDMTYEKWSKKLNNENISEPKSQVQISTAEDARKALKDIVGFSEVEESFFGIDEALQISNAKQLVNLENKFGAIHQSTGTIFARDIGRDVVAYVKTSPTNPLQQSLSLSPLNFSDRRKHIDLKREMINKGWSMPVEMTDEILEVYNVTHEYGHMLQNTLVAERMKSKGWDPNKQYAFLDLTKKSEKAMNKWYTKIRSGVENEHLKEIVEIAKESDPNFSLFDHISGYGKTKEEEFFAEVFANSQLGNPNKLGDAMNTWLVRKGLIIK